MGDTFLREQAVTQKRNATVHRIVHLNITKNFLHLPKRFFRCTYLDHMQTGGDDRAALAPVDLFSLLMDSLIGRDVLINSGVPSQSQEVSNGRMANIWTVHLTRNNTAFVLLPWLGDAD